MSTKIIAAAITMVVAVVGINYMVFMSGYQRDAEEALVAEASAFTAVITSISAASEEAGAGAGQSASAAAQLSQKAEHLRTLVGKFQM